MAYNSKAKIRILYLLKILQEQTDAEHGLTMAQIIDQLAAYGVSAERKSIYADLESLREFDIDIQTYQRNPVEYAIGRRDFSLGELMLMVDAIQSCRAITDRQAKLLITNIKTLASDHEQDLLNRRIHVVGRIKSKNESVFGTVDVIHNALRLGCKLGFTYQRAGGRGKRHTTTPVGIAYDDGFYYMTAWDDGRERLAEFRLDRMGGVRMLEDEPALRNKEISGHRYEREDAVAFGRFYGERVHAVLSAPAEKAEILTDRFGDAAVVCPTADGTVKVTAPVYKSEQFFGWIAGMGKAVTLAGPPELVDEYRAYLRFLLED
ncbi:MAG: WYL domain-containing protein [Collinsella sp.]|nr:WYL domain-containing protein [Collinsella sp.]